MSESPGAEQSLAPRAPRDNGHASQHTASSCGGLMQLRALIYQEEAEAQRDRWVSKVNSQRTVRVVQGFRLQQWGGSAFTRLEGRGSPLSSWLCLRDLEPALLQFPLPASLPFRMDHSSCRALLTCHLFRTSSQLSPPPPPPGCICVCSFPVLPDPCLLPVLSRLLAQMVLPWVAPSLALSLSPSRPRAPARAGVVQDPFLWPQRAQKGPGT